MLTTSVTTSGSIGSGETILVVMGADVVVAIRIRIIQLDMILMYRKVTSSRLFLLVALPMIFRRLMKEKFGAYALSLLAKSSKTE